MKTVRFTVVVKKSGKPEIYLLLTRDDQEFQKALKSDRIMSLLGGNEGSKTGYGVVGYEEKQRAQLLLFPKSLAAFKGSHVVGIKYDLFSDAEEEAPARTAKAAKPAAAAKASKPKKIKAAEAKEKKPKAKATQAKVIPFPKAKQPEEDEDESLPEIKGYVRQAIRALEKNNSVAAYNLLKRIVPLLIAAITCHLRLT